MRESYKLWLLYVVIVLVVIVRIIGESTSYTSPDSTYYLAAADHLMKGEGLVAPHPENPQEISYFAIWPSGYPLCIAGIVLLTGMDALVASKIVNLLFLGLTFALLYRWFGKKSGFVALYFCSFGMLEIYSYTWSEAGFLFFLLFLIDGVINDLEKERGIQSFFHLAFSLVFLFLFRYAGLIYFFAVGLLLVYFLLTKQKQKSINYFFALLFASTIVLVYFYINKQMTGFYTGIGDRVQFEQESLSEFLTLLMQGLVNQFSLARHYFYNGTLDYLYLALLVLQLLVLAVLLGYRKKCKVDFMSTNNQKILISMALFYLVSIVLLRKIQPFDAFDYRIMAPFTLPFFIALYGRLIQEDLKDYYKKVSPWIIGFMLLSLVINLPKNYLLSLLKNWVE